MSTDGEFRAVAVRISGKCLAMLLHLPENVRISRVRQNWEDEKANNFEFLIESPDVPVVNELDTIPWGNILIRSEFCEVDEITHIVSGELKVG